MKVRFALVLITFAVTSFATAASLKNVIVVPGAAIDKTQLNGRSGGANINRLGGFGSDIFYDRFANVFYGLTDRGPGGGTIGYATRVHRFTLDIDPATGAASNFNLLATIPFTIPAGKTVNGVAGPASFNGLDPGMNAPGGKASGVGLSHDPEGFVVAPNGHFYVSDEYGPSIYEFLPDGSFLRALHTPSNLLPSDANGPNFSSFNTVVPVAGRQRNRGFEGLAISPGGEKLFAMLQDPLSDEGAADAACMTGCAPPGRFSRNIRFIVYSTATGESIAQYIYQLESLASVNARLPKNSFGPNAQGANIAVSAVTAINDHEFLVLERDNRGLGIDDPMGLILVSSKRIYRIDISGATDVSRISLKGTNTLPQGVEPVSKKLFIDVIPELKAAGVPVPEKMEGIAIGPRLADGTYELLVGTDNDFSVTQIDSGTQFDVCANAMASKQVPIDAGCPPGMYLLPSFLLSFKTSAGEIELSSMISPLLSIMSDPGWQPAISRDFTSRLRDADRFIAKGRREEACKSLEGISHELGKRSRKPGASPLAGRAGTGLSVMEQTLGCKPKP
jgi:hypothetical protein